MTKYREVIRLYGLGLSQTNIALNSNASKTTINKVLKVARKRSLSWPLDPKLTYLALGKLLFPDSKAKPAHQSGCLITSISVKSFSVMESFWNFSIGDVENHLPSSVPSMFPMACMNSWVAITVPSRKRSWIASSMMHTRLTSSRRIRRITNPCGSIWIRSCIKRVNSQVTAT